MGFITQFYLAIALSAALLTCHAVEVAPSIPSLAEAYRSCYTIAAEAELQRKKELLELAYASLPHYGVSSLERAVELFLSDSLQVPPAAYKVMDIALMGQGGISSDRVFIVADRGDRLCYVVKAFANPRELSSFFLPEISALQLIKQLALPNVSAIKSLAFGCGSVKNKQWGLLLQSVAKGKRLDRYLLPLADHNLQHQRQDLIAAAKKAFYRVGYSLAKLHSHKSPLSGPIHALTLDNYAKDAELITTDPFIKNELTKKMPLARFQKLITKIKKQALPLTLFYTYRHGDAHLGNLFYDSKKDSCTFIDAANLHYSLDILAQPLDHGIEDLIQAEESLRRRAMQILSKEELHSLIAALYKGYADGGEALPDKRLLLFYRTWKIMRRLTIYRRYFEEQDANKMAANKAIFDSALTFFQNLLQKNK